MQLFGVGTGRSGTKSLAGVFGNYRRPTRDVLDSCCEGWEGILDVARGGRDGD